METKHQNGAAVQNGVAKEATKSPSATEVKAGQVNGKAETGKAKSTPPVASPQALENGQELPATIAPEPFELVKEQPVIAVLTLEAKLKAVDDLHRKSIQRLNLIKRKGELEAFEVKLESENDELSDNPYQGCKLIIEDDKRRQFVTTTPGLIRLVSQFIYNACDEKLKEIEESIKFPVG